MRGCRVKLLALADDLTGALEIGGIFGGRGAVSLVTTERTLDPPGLDGCTSILTVDTDSRHLPPDVAARRVAELARCAASRDIPFIYKKTDSTLRGNIGAELRGLMDAFPGQTVALEVVGDDQQLADLILFQPKPGVHQDGLVQVELLFEDAVALFLLLVLRLTRATGAAPGRPGTARRDVEDEEDEQRDQSEGRYDQNEPLDCVLEHRARRLDVSPRAQGRAAVENEK